LKLSFIITQKESKSKKILKFFLLLFSMELQDLFEKNAFFWGVIAGLSFLGLFIKPLILIAGLFTLLGLKFSDRNPFLLIVLGLGLVIGWVLVQFNITLSPLLVIGVIIATFVLLGIGFLLASI